MLERADWMSRAAEGREVSPLRGRCLAIAVGLHVAVAVFLLRSPLPAPPMASVPAGVVMEAVLMEMAPAAEPEQAVPVVAAETPADPPETEPLPAESPVPEPVVATAVPVETVLPPPVLAPPVARPVVPRPPLARAAAARRPARPAAAQGVAAEPDGGAAAPHVATATAAAVAVAASDAVPTWRGEVLGRLMRAKRYPEGARSRGEQGTAYATFTVDRDGHVLSASLVRGSGSYQLDAEAVALIHRAEPLPPMPAEMGGATATLTVPVVFGLR